MPQLPFPARHAPLPCSSPQGGNTDLLAIGSNVQEDGNGFAVIILVWPFQGQPEFLPRRFLGGLVYFVDIVNGEWTLRVIG